MQHHDLALRDDLAKSGALYDGYHPQMRALHESNADEMVNILDEIDWPTAELVGADASGAAWLIVQHAISRPDLMRSALLRLRTACDRGTGDKLHLAMLEDRICYLEGRPQVFGTTLDWDDDGTLGPGALQDEQHVDARRQSVGLEPLALALEQARKAASAAGEQAPADLPQRRRQAEQFAVAVGWR